MDKYIYDGPVVSFGECLCHKWNATTYAASEKRAICNLRYRYIKMCGLSAKTKITLPGKLNKEGCNG